MKSNKTVKMNVLCILEKYTLCFKKTLAVQARSGKTKSQKMKENVQEKRGKKLLESKLSKGFCTEKSRDVKLYTSGFDAQRKLKKRINVKLIRHGTRINKMNNDGRYGRTLTKNPQRSENRVAVWCSGTTTTY